MSAAEDKKRLLKLLSNLGYEGSYADFKTAFDRFKDAPEAIAALRRGVNRLEKEVDPGNYAESPSYNYDGWWKKNKLLEEHDLKNDKAFFDGVDPKTLASSFAPPAKKSEIAELREEVEGLRQRLLKLELAHQQPLKLKLKPKPPGI